MLDFDRYVLLNHIFIGGAPRSGTSLLVRLLDWHPEILSFPTEIAALEKYFAIPENEREKYFLENFLLDRSNGKQAMFGDPDYFKLVKQRLTQEFRTNVLPFEVDTSAFCVRYKEVLESEGPLLNRILKGLSYGFLNCNQKIKRRYGAAEKVKYIVFKRPYFTDLFAQDIAHLLPNSKFVYVQRSPLAQYISAKMRYIRNKSNQSKLLNGVDFATGLCDVRISSRRLAQDNLQALGSERYRIMSYENLISNPEQEMRALAEWLEVEFASSFLEPTRIGTIVEANSSFNEKKTRVNKTGSSREDEFHKNTSPSERALVYYLLGLARDLFDDYEFPKVESYGQRLWFHFFRYEHIRHYLRRILTSKFNPSTMPKDELRAVLGNRLPSLFHISKVNII